MCTSNVYHPTFRNNQKHHVFCGSFNEEAEDMTLFDFKLLGWEDQIEQVYREGVYIGKRRMLEQFVLLYQVESFYVELYYKKYRQSVLSIKCSASTSILDPYLEQIEVEDWA